MTTENVMKLGKIDCRFLLSYFTFYIFELGHNKICKITCAVQLRLRSDCALIVFVDSNEKEWSLGYQ